MTSPARYAPIGALARLPLRLADLGVSTVERLGHMATFVALVLRAIPKTLKDYRRQTGALLVDMTWGNGWIIVGGGTVGVLVFMGVAIGASVGIEGFAALDMVGMGPLTGFVSAYANTREMAPMIAAIGFAAQAGCRMTAEIGSMRISEEIDALTGKYLAPGSIWLEAQGIRSIPFVVTTRVIAGFITIVPPYLLTLLLSYLSCALVVNVLHGQSSGTYYHYFNSLIQPMDIVYSVIKVAIFVIAIIAIHGYQGYYASGGPEGVGASSGRAIRASLVTIVILDMILTLIFWGRDPGVRISG